MTSLNVKAVVFDLSGTLYRNKELDEQYPRELYNLIAESSKVSVDAAWHVFSGEKMTLEKKVNNHVTKLSVMESLGFDRKKVHDAYCRVEPEKYLRKDERLAGLLNKIRGKYALGLITNLRAVQAVRTLRALGVDETVFNGILGEESVSEVKPSSEPFIRMLDLLGLSAGECLYVSDSVTKDLAPAKKIGFWTVWVSDKEVKGEHGVYVDFVVKEVYEVLSLLGFPKPV